MLRSILYSFSAQSRTVIAPKPGKAPFLAVMAIGNPVNSYSGTRHNVGLWMLEQMQQIWPDMDSFKQSSRYLGFEESRSSSRELLMLKSVSTFMNLQGGVVQKAWSKFQNDFSEYSPALVVLHDEIQLPLGKIQIRVQNTSARGHNGLRSIDSKLGPGYVKISIGIGKPTNGAVDKYVLGKFKENELDILERDSVPKVEKALEDMVAGKHIFETKKQ